MSTVEVRPDGQLVVTLDEWEMRIAGYLGVDRRVDGALRSRQSKVSSADPRDAALWSSDLESALAELAAGKALGRYWSGGVNTWKGPDLHGGLQVRHSHHEGGHLIVRRADPEDDTYLLAIGSCGIYRIVGWIVGRDARRDEWWRDQNGKGFAWWVPQQALASPGTLRVGKEVGHDER